MLLFCRISARLLELPRAGLAIGALVFAACTAASPMALWAWVVPWSTTPACVALYAALLAGLRFLDRPRPSAALAVGLLCGATAWFRPADALCFAVVATPILLSAPAALRWAIMGAAVAGMVLPLAGLGLLHWMIHGWQPGEYVSLSARLGFEWRLLPRRWVLLVLSPRPLLASGQGLAERFVWLLPGLAGMVAMLLASGTRRRTQALVIGVALADFAMFLTYRDLHPPALWRYLNYHYFRWLLPLFGLYAMSLLRLLLAQRRVPALAGLGLVGLLSCWRIEATGLRPLPAGEARFSSLSDGVLVPAADPLGQAYFGPDRIDAGMAGSGATFRNTEDFKTYAVPGGLMLLPLRTLPDVPGRFEAPVGTVLDITAPWFRFHQNLVFGVPCWLRACPDQLVLTPPVLPSGVIVRFGNGRDGEVYLLAGWSGPGADGHWSEGDAASMALSLPPDLVGHDVTLSLLGYGFIAGGSPPVRVTIRVVGQAPVRARFSGERILALRLHAAPAAMILRFAIENPRRPSAWSGSTDGRKLGLFIEAISVASSSR